MDGPSSMTRTVMSFWLLEREGTGRRSAPLAPHAGPPRPSTIFAETCRLSSSGELGHLAKASCLAGAALSASGSPRPAPSSSCCLRCSSGRSLMCHSWFGVSGRSSSSSSGAGGSASSGRAAWGGAPSSLRAARRWLSSAIMRSCRARHSCEATSCSRRCSSSFCRSGLRHSASKGARLALSGSDSPDGPVGTGSPTSVGSSSSAGIRSSSGSCGVPASSSASSKSSGSCVCQSETSASPTGSCVCQSEVARASSSSAQATASGWPSRAASGSSGALGVSPM
mmetsp:Transcript_17551/g.52819  ORF Transcript_17551/g.52819 Transcript_17551/m.52819 type:complete len:282 (-) Transcript_17551:567-1412(-)